MTPFAPRLKTRGPALFLGLALSGFAAACTAEASGPATATAPATATVACEIALDAIPGGTRVEGRVTAPRAVSGSYAMAIDSRSGGGSATIRQSGEFRAPAGRSTFATTDLTGSPARHAIDLSITIDGERRACARPAL